MQDAGYRMQDIGYTHIRIYAQGKVYTHIHIQGIHIYAQGSRMTSGTEWSGGMGEWVNAAWGRRVETRTMEDGGCRMEDVGCTLYGYVYGYAYRRTR